MTTDAATYVPPTVQHAVTWQALTLANPSLQSWERSAATAGSRGLSWWLRWATGSRYLMVNVRTAIGDDDSDGFHEALDVARRHVREMFEAARLVHPGHETLRHVQANNDRRRGSAANLIAKR